MTLIAPGVNLHRRSSLGELLTEPHFFTDRQIGLLLVDIENVVGDFGADEPFDEYRDLNSRAEELGVRVAAVTNMTDAERARNFDASLCVPAFYQGMLIDEVPLRSKMTPDMYQAALETVGHGPNGNRTAMVDDQLKNIRGAKEAGVAEFVWTKPQGQHQHRGVKLARPVETVVGFVSRTADFIPLIPGSMKFGYDILRGKEEF